LVPKQGKSTVTIKKKQAKGYTSMLLGQGTQPQRVQNLQEAEESELDSTKGVLGQEDTTQSEKVTQKRGETTKNVRKKVRGPRKNRKKGMRKRGTRLGVNHVRRHRSKKLKTAMRQRTRQRKRKDKGGNTGYTPGIHVAGRGENRARKGETLKQGGPKEKR